MAKLTKQVRIWDELNVVLLAEKMTAEKGLDVSQTEAVSIAVQEALERRKDIQTFSAALAEIREENAIRGD